MEIIFHEHHATISDRMRRRAESSVRAAAARLSRAVDAIIRFEQDGPVKRVEIVLHAPRQRDLVARGESRFYGRSLASAVDKLAAQVRRTRMHRRAAQRVRSLEKATGG